MIIRCLFDELVDVKKLKAHPKNRNTHPDEQITRLAKILAYQGWRYPVKVSKRSGFITSGHGSLLAAKSNKWKQVPVNYQDYESDEQEYADLQADNAIALWAELDLSGINTDLGDLGPDFDIDLLGLKDFELVIGDTLEPQCDEDEVGESPAEPTTKLGDVYKLGRHRLMCGDSTSSDDVAKLMEGEKACITFSSPPYNVGRTPNGNEQKYLNDSDTRGSLEFTSFLKKFTTEALRASHFVFVNIQSLAGNKLALIDYLYAMRESYGDTMIWDKMTAEPAMAKNVLNSRFEYVHVFSERANRVIGTKAFRGTLENVFQLNSRKDKEFSDIHKATFPVGFAQHFVENFSKTSVLDLFGGSGTTMIAAEKLGRNAYLMELDPKYCDVIVARWEKYTGKKAELVNGG